MRRRLKMFAAMLTLCVSLSSLPVGAVGLGGEDSIGSSEENRSSEEAPEESAGESINDEEAPEESAGESINDEEAPEESAGESINGEEVPEESAEESINGEEVPEESAEESINGEEISTESVEESINGEEISTEEEGNSEETPAEDSDGNRQAGSLAEREAVVGNMADQNAEPEFFYTQDFSELGVRVNIHAVDYAIPQGASVQVLVVEDGDSEELGGIIQEKMDEALEKKRDTAVNERSVFEMYADLQAEVEKSSVFQIRISYIDGEGRENVIYPEGNDNIEISFQLLYPENIPEDEMHAAEFYSLTDELPAFFSESSASAIYSFVVVRYAAKADAQTVAAQQKAWDIINTYAAQEYFLTDPYRDELTDTQYEELRRAAINATAGCATDYDKIKAVITFVADRTYYDYYYLNNKGTVSVYVNPYDVYTYKRTVCAGYAKLVRTLLVSIGIPCMDIIGENHEYNAAYDSQQGRWIFADATWCSRNSYNIDSNGNEMWDYKGNNYKYFDLGPEEIALLSSHEVYGVDGLSDGTQNTAYYSLTAPESNWNQMDWYMEITGIKNPKADALTAQSMVAGFPVTGVKSWAFADRDDITGSIILPEGIKKIGKYAFYNCTGLKGTLTLPASLTNIEEWAFANCSGLRGGLMVAVDNIGKCAFYNCKGLDGTLMLAANVVSIGEWAFAKCSGLTGSLVLPQNLTSIGDYAFLRCGGFTGELRIPPNVKNIGKQAFAFFEGSLLDKNIVLEGATESIGDSAFYRSDCSKKQITIYAPEGSYAENYANANGYMYARKFMEYDGCTFYKKGNNDITCRNNAGSLIRNEFKCDGTYTYFFQADGTAMMDRLSYHPDGKHVIYFDSNGHEVFSDFANVRKTIAGDSVDDFCFFDVYGYLYVDVVTYDKTGTVLYYANPYGVMERGKWFQFSDTVKCADGTPWAGAAGGYGYANADGTLMKDQWTYDWEGRYCYMQGNGVALYK